MFLELNPDVPRSQAFVDGYDFEAYKAVGFGNFDEISKEELMDVKMKAPSIGGPKKWWKYVSNVISLSPVEKGKSGVPEGVKRLGGTFVVNGDDIVYKWSDRLPGDTPEVSEIMEYVKKSVKQMV